MSYIIRIKESKAVFTGTDNKIADYFLNKPKEASLLSANEIGSRTGTSASAVMRFLKKINYNSLNELRAALSNESDNSFATDELIIQKDDSLDDIVSKLTAKIIENTRSTAALLNMETLSLCMEKLNRADTIFLFGIGASGIVASDLQQKFLRIKRKCIYHYDGNVQLASSTNITSRDVALVFSYSGKTREIMLSLKQAKENGAFCILVTKADETDSSNYADSVFKLPCSEPEIRLGAIQSRYSELFISDIIYLCAAQNNFGDVEKRLYKTRNIIDILNGR